jgi:hypothetical protein
MTTFDPDGGELGRATRVVTPLEFQLLIPHVAEIINALKVESPRKYYVHPFEFRGEDKNCIELVILSAKLPSDVHFYETDGKKIFEIRGPSGGVVSSLICYLVTK